MKFVSIWPKVAILSILGLITALLMSITASPQIAYASVSSGDVIYVAGGNIWRWSSSTTGITQLTTNGDSLSPDVSPDGSKIAFRAADPDPAYPTYITWIMNSDGSGKQPLDPQNPNNQYADFSPKWSPNGESISVTRISNGGAIKIYLF